VREEEEAERDDGKFPVWPENVETVQVFLELLTQWVWVWSGRGMKTSGMNYAAVIASLPRLGVKRKRRDVVFAGLREMEKTLLPLLNEPAGG